MYIYYDKDLDYIEVFFKKEENYLVPLEDNEHVGEFRSEKDDTNEALIIENLNENFDELLLFSLWNFALQDNKYLLTTSTNPISAYNIKLPDLKSRASSSLMIGINLPSDDLISVILAKNFSDKQIKIEKKHIDYIIKRIDRSYEKISQFILTLDKYSLKKGSPFSLKLIKEVLKMI